MDRSSCSQRIFGGCMGDGCERRCSAVLAEESDRFARNAASRREQARTRALIAWAVFIVLIPVFLFAASVGFERQERAYQQEARI